MIRHIVLLKIKTETSQDTVGQIERALAGLKDKIPGILSFDWGPYSSDEGLNKGFTHGFVMDFESAAARAPLEPPTRRKAFENSEKLLLFDGVEPHRDTPIPRRSGSPVRKP